jgi:hypothetical protein
MGPRLQKTLLFLGVFGLLGTTSCAGPAKKEGYFRYSAGRLMFKLPPGEWEQIREVPAPYNTFIVEHRPRVVLTARIRPAVIFIWTKQSPRNFSERPIEAYKWLEAFLKTREKAVERSKQDRYFDYEFLAGAIAARTVLGGDLGDVQLRGSGKAMFYYHDGNSHLYYFELLADSAVFEAVKDEFTEALKETHGY